MPDCVYEFVSDEQIGSCLASHDELEAAVRALVELAFENGSDDNLTVQVVRVGYWTRGEL